MKAAHIVGMGFWSRVYSDSRAWGGGGAELSNEPPAAALISSRFRRYTSAVTRMAAQVFEEAVADAEVDPGTLSMVFGSAQGEIGFATRIISDIRADGSPSPAMFMNSVHNTAPAHLSIATSNMGFFTSIAAGRSTVAMCLLEATMLLEDGHTTVALVLADESLPAPLDDHRHYDAVACAFILQHDPTVESRGRLANLRPEHRELETADLPDQPVGNPCAVAATLIRRAIQNRPGTVVLATEPGWCVDLEAV